MTTYYVGQALPALALEWKDRDSNLIDYSSGWTFRVDLLSSGGTIMASKTTGITGAATSPNVIIDWANTDFDGLSGNYRVYIKATRTSDSKFRVFNDETLPSIRIVTAPT